MKDKNGSDPQIIEALENMTSATVAVLEHLVASDKVLIEVVAMLADRAIADDRVDDVRPIVKALGQTKAKSKNSLEAIKKLIITTEKLTSQGGSDEK